MPKTEQQAARGISVVFAMVTTATVATSRGDDYGAPDGLWFDREGGLWIQTDPVGNATGDWVNIDGNVMMCADPVTGEPRRFLTSLQKNRVE